MGNTLSGGPPGTPDAEAQRVQLEDASKPKYERWTSTSMNIKLEPVSAANSDGHREMIPGCGKPSLNQPAGADHGPNTESSEARRGAPFPSQPSGGPRMLSGLQTKAAATAPALGEMIPGDGKPGLHRPAGAAVGEDLDGRGKLAVAPSPSPRAADDRMLSDGGTTTRADVSPAGQVLGVRPGELGKDALIARERLRIAIASPTRMVGGVEPLPEPSKPADIADQLSPPRPTAGRAAATARAGATARAAAAFVELPPGSHRLA